MKLDRNINPDGAGKYALVKLRELDRREPGVQALLLPLRRRGALDYGDAGTESEFFVIRLKDKYAQAALEAYAAAAEVDDPEYAREVREMASRAGPDSPWCKRPD